MNGRILIAHVGDASVLQADVTISAIAPEETLTDHGFLCHVRAIVLGPCNRHQIVGTVCTCIELGYAVAVVEVGQDFCAIPAVFVHAAIASHHKFAGCFWQIGEGMVI